MKKTISENDFVFEVMDREDQFSDYALRKIFEYIETVEDDTGEEYEMDIIDICCEFTEYESLEDLQKDYPDIENVDDLECETSVICFEDDCIVIVAY